MLKGLWVRVFWICQVKEVVGDIFSLLSFYLAYATSCPSDFSKRTNRNKTDFFLNISLCRFSHMVSPTGFSLEKAMFILPSDVIQPLLEQNLPATNIILSE